MDTRKCFRCKVEMPLAREFFYRDKNRPAGLSYECRQCLRLRKLGRDNRTDRWENFTPEQKLVVRARQQRYARTDKGRAVFLRSAYKKIDACDLATSEVLALIQQPCCYCGTTESPRGLDRIDNTLPHIKGNVRQACAPCNFARGDRFTAAEMDIIGAAIRKVMQDRLSATAPNADHPESRLASHRPTGQGYSAAWPST